MYERKEKIITKPSKANKRISYWGVSPHMVIILTPFTILFALLHFIFFPVFLLPFEQIYMIIIGLSLIIIGAIIYIKSLKLIKKAYFASELVTSGVYGHMRHPLYSSFILFIYPGIICMFNSWILFFIPIVHYTIFRFLIKREENYCLKMFGEKYIHYKKFVYAIFPKLKKYESLKD
ncbi:MAG: methyltransferase family protein [Promethearchaeota archaeon]